LARLFYGVPRRLCGVAGGGGGGWGCLPQGKRWKREAFDDNAAAAEGSAAPKYAPPVRDENAPDL